MDCPICRSNARLFYNKQPTLLICTDCRHIFWDKLPTDSELNEYYSTKYTSSHSQMDIQKENITYYQSHCAELKLIHGNEPSSIIDYGCSYPFFLIESKKEGFINTIGIEWDEDSRKMGIDSQLTMIAPDEIDLIENHSIDIARFSHVLEHAIDPMSIVRKISLKLKPGGLVYITQPSFPVLAAEQSVHDLRDAVYPEHLHFFSPISLKLMFESAGLEITKLFTHQNAAQVIKTHADNLDVHYASSKLYELMNKGDLYFGSNSNYPVYAGENVVLYARKI